MYLGHNTTSINFPEKYSYCNESKIAEFEMNDT